MSKVAIIMSVYKLDTISNLKECIESLMNQDHHLFDVFIMVDGIVDVEVHTYLLSLSLLDNFNVFFNMTNLGLATRLNELIDIIINKKNKCSYKFIARMDADDISMKNRISKQVEFFDSNEIISVIGSNVIEIDNDGNDLFNKKMDLTHNVMLENIIKRCPFNHPTVMFRVEIFMSGEIRYKNELKNTQDYYLWIDLISAGYYFSNVDDFLLKFRVDNNFHSRRGLEKAINDVKSRLYALKKLNNYSVSNFIHITLLFMLRISPSKIKKLAYRFLRN